MDVSLQARLGAMQREVRLEVGPHRYGDEQTGAVKSVRFGSVCSAY